MLSQFIAKAVALPTLSSFIASCSIVVWYLLILLKPWLSGDGLVGGVNSRCDVLRVNGGIGKCIGSKLKQSGVHSAARCIFVS